MKRLQHYFESEKGKKVKNLIIGGGASVVLMGALFKIQHWSGAGTMLVIGMSVEAFIFALQGILPPHPDYYWEKLYPHLDIHPDHDARFSHEQALEEGTTVTQQLEGMMQESNIEEELITRLGEGFKKLEGSVSGLADMSNAAVATNEYAENARAAASQLADMKSAYQGASQSVSELAEAATGASDYHEQVQAVAKNLGSLNSMYELEMQDTNNHMKAMNQFYTTLTQATEEMNQSLEDTRIYKEEMAKLAQNLSSLNSVYGNVLSAMSVRAAGGMQGDA